MRACCEASLSCQCHGTCLNIDFHGIDSGEESHGGCDRRLAMAERSFGCVEAWRHRVFSCVSCVEGLKRRLARGGGNTCGQHFWGCYLSTELQSSG